MRSYLLYGLVVVRLWTACNKENGESDFLDYYPSTPQMFTVDLNDDTTVDFRIEYSFFAWDGIEASGDGIYALISGLPEIAVLLNEEDRPLFLQQNDTVYSTGPEMTRWTSFFDSVGLLSIRNSSDNGYKWPDEWEINSAQDGNPYYLGLKMKVDEIEFIGWVKLAIDKKKGTITVLDKHSTAENFLHIDQ